MTVMWPENITIRARTDGGCSVCSCPHDEYEPTWPCPLLEGKAICDVCCLYDMDAADWPRGVDPGVCAATGCPHAQPVKQADK